MIQNLYQELKRRNVLRVAAAYVLMAWLALQATDVLASLLELPSWVGRAVLLLLLIGFVVALVLSWIYELTPEGVKLEKDVDRSSSVTSQTGRKLDVVIIGVLATVVIFLVLDKFVLSERAGTEAPPEALVTTASIAVLPFANMSSDQENEYFADGLSEELLNVLAQIDGLLVAGRTSSFHFKGKNEDLRLIGEQLGVGHILEGSVRKSGDSVRITAQLIKADDGFHLWSETYDRRLDDIFRIQDEIAESVAVALRTRLLGEDESVVEAQANISPNAYARFIAARSRIAEGGHEDLVNARTALEEIIDEAPDYAPAYAALAIASLEQWRGPRTIPATEARGIAREAMERALELSPDDDYVVTAHGVYLSELVENASDAGLRRVNDVFRRAIELNPENVEAMYYLAFNLRYLEEYEETLDLLDRALRIDPLDTSARSLRIWALIENGRFEEAIAYIDETLRLFPEELGFYFRGVQAEYTRGRPDRALAWLYALNAKGAGSPFMTQREYELATSLGFAEGADQALEALRSADDISAELFEAARARDAEEGLRVVRRGIEDDGWANWEVEHFFTAIMADECDAAFESRFAGRVLREWSEGNPRVDSTNDNRATWTALCMRRKGQDELADALLRATLDYAAPRPGRFDDPGLRRGRIAAYAMLGEKEQSIAEFQAYYDAGFGALPLIPYEADPRYVTVAGEPEFQRIVEAVKARNLRRLERMIDSDFSLDTPL